MTKIYFDIVLCPTVGNKELMSDPLSVDVDIQFMLFSMLWHKVFCHDEYGLYVLGRAMIFCI